MARVVIFDQQTGRVKKYLPSADTPQYEGRSDVLINPDMAAVEGVAQMWWIVDPPRTDGVLREMTDAEKAPIKSDQDAALAKAAAKAAVIAGLDLMGEIHGELARAGVSNAQKDELLNMTADISALLVSGRINEAKIRAALLTTSGTLEEATLNVLKDVLK
jgi:hypothetical protein